MPTDTIWERFVGRRIGSATSVLFGIGFTAVSLANFIVLLLYPIRTAAGAPVS